MKLQYLIILGLLSGVSQAMSPSQGGATGTLPYGMPPTEASLASGISSCELKSNEQSKVVLKDKTGKIHHICTGTAICGRKAVPVSCQVAEKELCPIAKKCVRFQGTLPLGINVSRYKFPNNVSYWTDDKIQKAIPEDLPVLDFSSFKKIIKTDLSWLRGEPELLIKPRYPLSFKSDPQQKAGKAFLEKNEINANTPNGMLIFTKKGKEGACSASTVFVDHKNFKGKVVVTSAHCLFSREENVWVTNPVFIPGLAYDSSSKRYPVKSVIFASDWIDPNTQLPYRLDAVILELYEAPKGNCCYGLYLNNVQGPGLAMGFPGEPFTGKNLYSVLYERDGITPYSPSLPEPLTDNIFWAMNSDMKKGSSGGPWVGYDPTGRTYGFITGLTSYGSRDRDNLVVSPVLGEEFKEIYKCLIGEKPVCPTIN